MHRARRLASISVTSGRRLAARACCTRFGTSGKGRKDVAKDAQLGAGLWAVKRVSVASSKYRLESVRTSWFLALQLHDAN